jgi:hypothetical protein
MNIKTLQHKNTTTQPQRQHKKPPQQALNPAPTIRATKQAVATSMVGKGPPKRCLHGGHIVLLVKLYRKDEFISLRYKKCLCILVMLH